MENKKENFKRIAENRTNKIIDMIAGINNNKMIFNPVNDASNAKIIVTRMTNNFSFPLLVIFSEILSIICL